MAERAYGAPRVPSLNRVGEGIAFKEMRAREGAAIGSTEGICVADFERRVGR